MGRKIRIGSRASRLAVVQSELVMEEIRKIKEVQNITLNKVAIVKYDAFKEMGGKLSFALAMLDKESSGFVMYAIHSSDGCYTYV